MSSASTQTFPFKLAAIDLDGTLLSPDLSISAGNRQAVARLQSLGVEVVLASGRHYQTMRTFAEALRGIEWLVSLQGGEVSNLEHTRILSQTFLPTSEVKRALTLGLARDVAVVAYSAHGSFTTTKESESLRFYSALAGHSPEPVSIDAFLTQPIFKIIWVGNSAQIDALSNLQELDTLVSEKVRTHQRLFEFLPLGVSKATGLATLGEHLGIKAAEMMTFGDADNDIPMLRWAGCGVAMAHGWPEALASAKLVAPEGPPETAFARGVALVLALNHVT